MEVKSFKDSDGNVVKIGDTVGYHSHNGELRDKGKVSRIKKMGYHISVYIEGRLFQWYPPYLKKITEEISNG